MNEKEIIEKYKNIIASLLSNNIKKAFDSLSTLLAQTHKVEWNDKKDSLEENYHYLLKYVIDGINDPEQENVLNKLKSSILLLANQAYNAAMTIHSNAYPYIQKRNISKSQFPQNNEIEEYLILGTDNNTEKCEDIRSSLFYRLWLKAIYTDRETVIIDRFIYSDDSSITDQCLVVSALMLGLLLQFDEKKFDTLISIVGSTTGSVQTRAFIGLILCCNIHSQSLLLHNNLQKKLQNLSKKNWFNEKFAICILFYINGLETKKISQELANDIMPDLIKETSKITNKLDLKDLLKNPNLTENPEWDSSADKWDISDKIQRFAEMQKNGADVFLGTFSSMKNHYFFSKIYNWFRPYDTTNYWVKKEFRGNSYKLFGLISLNPTICNSDRYSMLFSLSSIPESYLKNIEDSLAQQEEQIKHLQDDGIFSETNGKDRIDAQLYWQDLYRFFKLFPNRSSFPDPYETSLDIIGLPFIQNVDDKAVLSIAESFLKKKFYNEALSLLKLINSRRKNEGKILQRMGFCYQKLNMFNEALDCYEKAELMSSNNDWINKMKAFCLSKSERYEEALLVYKTQLENDSDNLSLLYRVTDCYIELKQYDQALPLLFKIDYLEQSSKVNRLIAWCALSCDKLEQANNYLLKIVETERSTNDWKNLGHIAWISKNKAKAIEYYGKAKALANDVQELTNSIQNDIPILEKYGVDIKEMPFVLDSIRYL